MKLQSITYAAKQFTWEGNFGCSEASDLQVQAGRIPGDRMYDDSADWGFYVQGKSEKIAFFFEDELRKGHVGDVEVYGFSYKSGCGKYTIHILND